MKKDELEKQYRLTLNSIKDIIDEFNNELPTLDKQDVISACNEMTEEILEIVNSELNHTEIDIDDLVNEKNSKQICRIVPIEPMARANYVITNMKRDIDSCIACQEYNKRMGVDIKNNGIKYWKGITEQEYKEIIRDYNFIKSQLHGKLKKHKPVFEELIMKGLTLQQYADYMRANQGNKRSQAFNIKWSFNKKQSLILAISKCYITEMASMKYYNGIQKENAENDGRDYYAVEREIVCEALTEVDNHNKEYFLAMKEAYIKTYEVVESMRKDLEECRNRK